MTEFSVLSQKNILLCKLWIGDVKNKHVSKFPYLGSVWKDYMEIDAEFQRRVAKKKDDFHMLSKVLRNTIISLEIEKRVLNICPPT